MTTILNKNAMLLTNQSNLTGKEKEVDDILLNFQKKRKSEQEISANMEIDTIADIITDKLMLKIQNSLDLTKDKK